MGRRCRMSELRPCPFCGGVADPADDDHEAPIMVFDDGPTRMPYFVQCGWLNDFPPGGFCGASGPFADSEQGAINAWNEQALADRVRELEFGAHGVTADELRAENTRLREALGEVGQRVLSLLQKRQALKETSDE